MISEAIWVALIVAIPTALTSFVAPLLMERSRRMDKREDRAREDLVAERLRVSQTEARDAAAKLALQQQDMVDKTSEAAELLLASNDKVAQVAKETNDTTISARSELAGKIDGLKGDLKEVHTLVNSNLTKVTVALFEAVEAKLIYMREMADTAKRLGQEPSPALAADIQKTAIKLEELRAELGERQRQNSAAAVVHLEEERKK